MSDQNVVGTIVGVADGRFEGANVGDIVGSRV